MQNHLYTIPNIRNQKESGQRLVEWNPCSENEFASTNGHKMELFRVESTSPTNGKCKTRELKLNQSFEIPTGSLATCMSWYSQRSDMTSSVNNSLMAIGTSTGKVSLINWTKMSSSDECVIYDPSLTPRKRICTGVSWNSQSVGLLAAGFEKSRRLLLLLFFFK
jgi:hypothetical protein